MDDDELGDKQVTILEDLTAKWYAAKTFQTLT